MKLRNPISRVQKTMCKGLLFSLLGALVGMLIAVKTLTDGKLYDIFDVAPNLLSVVTVGVIGAV